MSLKIRLGLVLFATCLSLSAANKPAPAGPVKIEDIVKQQAIWHTTISRDGQYVTYSILADAHYIDFAAALAFRNLATGKVNGVATGDHEVANDPRWVTNSRIIYGMIPATMSAIDQDGKNYTGLLGLAREFDQWERQRKSGKNFMPVGKSAWASPPHTDGTVLFQQFDGAKSGQILLQDFDHPLSFAHAGDGWASYPNVMSMNTNTAEYSRIIKNPGKVVSWLADKDGVIRAGVEHGEGTSKVIYRENEGAPWRDLPELGQMKPTVGLLGLSGDNNTLYVSKVTPSGMWGVYTYDLQQQKSGELLLSDEHYDILRTNAMADGHSIERLVFAPVTHALLGIQYVTDKPNVVWYDETMAKVQATLDHSLHNRNNTIADMSDDMKKFIVYTWTAKDPGGYFILDLENKGLKPLFLVRPWFRPEQMGEVNPISYTARDGTEIHGYLTVPAGRPPYNLPLVVMPHDGPLRRDFWGFQEEAQFLASRGYAVLQINYRGTPGFGEEFHEKGFGHVNEVLDDITDGARWAIAEGTADAHRVAIYGSGHFGGYCALMGVTREPELYRCCVDLAGIADWWNVAKRDQKNLSEDNGVMSNGAAVTDEQWRNHYEAVIESLGMDRPFGQRTYLDLLGESGKTDAGLIALSPVAHVDRIRAPLLVVYNKDDLSFSYKQSRYLREALDKAHKSYQSVKYKGDPKGLLFADRVDLFQKIEQFLAANMTP